MKRPSFRNGAPKGQKMAKGKAKPAAPSAATARLLVGNRVHPQIVLRNTMLVLDLAGTYQFQVKSARVTLLATVRRPIHWRFAGSNGTVTIELPRKEAWDLIEEVQEQSIASVRARRKKKGTAT